MIALYLIAIKKYKVWKKFPTESSAIRQMMLDSINPIFDKSAPLFYDDSGDAKIPRERHIEFRHNKYWCEEVDNLYKSHRSFFEDLYKKYAQKHMTPIDKTNFSKVDEFECLFVDCKLVVEPFV